MVVQELWSRYRWRTQILVQQVVAEGLVVELRDIYDKEWDNDTGFIAHANR
jgi:hypothetical protein